MGIIKIKVKNTVFEMTNGMYFISANIFLENTQMRQTF